MFNRGNLVLNESNAPTGGGGPVDRRGGSCQGQKYTKGDQLPVLHTMVSGVPSISVQACYFGLALVLTAGLALSKGYSDEHLSQMRNETLTVCASFG